MQTAIKLKTIVQPGGRIEIEDSQLPPGENVEVIILIAEKPAITRRSVMDILAETEGHRLFQSPDDVDEYLRKERSAWDS